jgi:uncharacterized protein
MLYADTSVLVASIAQEKGNEGVYAWFMHINLENICISDWVIAEFSSALSIKIRTRQILQSERDEALILFNRLVEERFKIFPVTSQHFHTAAKFAQHHELALRAGDALHLAIAAENNAVLHTLDKRLAEAGPHLGIRTELL